ncbi:MAG: hypothetical protein ACE5I8_01740 [Thermodesulfobacteriota bacterium]
MGKRGLSVKPIKVEVINLMLTVQTEECKNCRLIFEETDMKRKFADKEMNEYPEDVKEDVVRLSNWIRELAHLYSHRIQIKVIDALSPLGLYKTVRHRIREFPTFIIDRRETYSGWDKEALGEILNMHLQLHS